MVVKIVAGGHLWLRLGLAGKLGNICVNATMPAKIIFVDIYYKSSFNRNMPGYLKALKKIGL